MSAKADLEKRVERLKDRIQKAGEEGERPLPPERIRTFRKRLKRTQRKLAKGVAKEERGSKEAKPAEEKPTEAKGAEKEPAEEKPVEEETSEEKTED